MARSVTEEAVAFAAEAKKAAGHAQEVGDLKRALDSALRRLDKEKKSKADLVDAVYRAASDCFAALELPAVPPPPRARQAGAPEVAVAMLGDLQLGKKTPAYDSKVCEKRVERYAEKIRTLTDIQRKDHPVREARVWMLGDMIEGGGNIFPGQQWLIDSSLYRQVALDGPRILGKFLRALLAHFDKVHVTAIIGNHGRLGRWGEYDPESNGDRLLYRITQQLMESEKRLTWTIPDGMGERHWYAVDRIGNYSCLLFHGDQMGGKFQGSLTRVAVQRKVAGWRGGAIPEPFKDVAFGHWHQLYEDNVSDITVRCNGSTECTNTFAQELLAAKSVPFQRLMYVHPEKGRVTAEHKVDLG
jgi:hypothetical protein